MKKVITLVMVLLLFCSVRAQGPDFIIQEENVEITINSDSTVEIWYFLTIKTTRGPQQGIYLGIPTNAISDYAASQNGQMLTVQKETDRLKIWFLDEVQSGAVTELKVSFTAEGMIYPDEEGRLGMEFYPAWWDDQRMEVLHVKFILPEGCDISEVGNYPATAENRGMEGGRAFVYFERANLSPGYKFKCGVSFPEEYITVAVKERPPPTEPPKGPSISATTCCIAFILLFVIGMFVLFYYVAKKIKYISPKMMMESLGARKDLDPVEAAYVLDAHPLKLVNLMLLGLVRKGAIKILEWGPVKTEILEQKKKEEAFNCPNCGAPLDSAVELQFCEYCGSEVRLSGTLTYYENQFLLTCIKKDGTLDQGSVSKVLEALYKKVDTKLTGYSRKETAGFYRNQIQNYWTDIETATEEDKYNLFGKRVDWLMADPDFDERTKDRFKGVSAPYTPSSWWLWYNLGRATNGREFYEKISTGKKKVENESGLSKKSLEKNWEKHATPGKPSARVTHSHKSCVCDCVSCACACACVSCACACASGGGF
ncbi:MAG: zinc ribbon domain-containing protein [Theionarchaea archaeon]|nr:zinc ribbon domain-containing protein [Theionarchaea archaeon]